MAPLGGPGMVPCSADSPKAHSLSGGRVRTGRLPPAGRPHRYPKDDPQTYIRELPYARLLAIFKIAKRAYCTPRQPALNSHSDALAESYVCYSCHLRRQEPRTPLPPAPPKQAQRARCPALGSRPRARGWGGCWGRECACALYPGPRLTPPPRRPLRRARHAADGGRGRHQECGEEEWRRR